MRSAVRMLEGSYVPFNVTVGPLLGPMVLDSESRCSFSLRELQQSNLCNFGDLYIQYKIPLGLSKVYRGVQL